MEKLKFPKDIVYYMFMFGLSHDLILFSSEAYKDY